MITAKGYAPQRAESPLAPWQFERRKVGARDVQIEILYCGVCHPDIHLTRNEWFEGIFPMVPGHEIVGRISALGTHARKFSIGDLGVVGAMVDSCRECPDCKNEQEQFCSVAPVQTYNNLGHDGQPVYGEYSNTIVFLGFNLFYILLTMFYRRVARN